MKIYWDASAQEKNITVDGKTEEYYMQKMVDDILRKPFPSLITNYRNNPACDLQTIVKDSNSKSCDLHLALHTNAGGGTGVEAWVNMNNPRAVELATKGCQKLAAIMGIPNRGVKDGIKQGLLAIKGTAATAVLFELCFHDNASDLDKLKTHWNEVVDCIHGLAVGFLKTNVHALEYSPNAYSFKVDLGIPNKLETVLAIVKSRGAVAGVNLGFFDMAGKAEHYGLLMLDGVIKNPPNYTWECWLTKDNKFVVQDIATNAQIPLDAQWAVGLSFPLVVNGKKNLDGSEKFDHAKRKEPRTAIGQKANGNIVMVAVDSPGMTADELADLMLSLGCMNAINADGGGSTTMVQDGKIINKPENGERAVGSVLLVYPKNQPVTWEERVMKRLYDEKIINSEHNPKDNVTWAELAAVVGEVLDRC